jgi:uncharacterized protein YndB with AHSA1/START domain
MVMRRSREIAAPKRTVWSLATDPYHLPRWWPATQRVENVNRGGWTLVFSTPRGRTVRADFSLVTTEPPALARWRQDLEGTPFGRIFASVDYTLRLEGEDGAVRAELAVDQRYTGMARFGRFQLRRAARRQLDEALAGLAEIAEAHGSTDA